MSPYDYEFYFPGSITVTTDSQHPGWGVFVALPTGETFILLPNSIAVSFAFIRVRNDGGASFDIYGRDTGNNMTVTTVVSVDVTSGNPETLLLCADENPFDAIKVENPSGEPQIFEICVPAQESECFLPVEEQ